MYEEFRINFNIFLNTFNKPDSIKEYMKKVDIDASKKILENIDTKNFINCLYSLGTNYYIHVNSLNPISIPSNFEGKMNPRNYLSKHLNHDKILNDHEFNDSSPCPVCKKMIKNSQIIKLKCFCSSCKECLKEMILGMIKDHGFNNILSAKNTRLLFSLYCKNHKKMIPFQILCSIFSNKEIEYFQYLTSQNVLKAKNMQFQLVSSFLCPQLCSTCFKLIDVKSSKTICTRNHYSCIVCSRIPKINNGSKNCPINGCAGSISIPVKSSPSQYLNGLNLNALKYNLI